MNSAPADPNQAIAGPRGTLKVSRRAIIFAVATFASYGLARSVVRYDYVHPGIKIAFGAFFACCFGAFLWQSERDILASEDELAQKIRLEAIALAFPAFMAAVMVLGMLHDGGVLRVKPVHYWWLGIHSYALALFWSKRRYS